MRTSYSGLACAGAAIFTLGIGCTFEPAVLTFEPCSGDCDRLHSGGGDALLAGDSQEEGDTDSPIPADTCTDGITNQDEIGIDCGGSCPLLCGVCQEQAEIPVTECQALQALYQGTKGGNWTNADGWMATSTPCTWFGITCESGHVTEILLNANNLSGPIPPDLGRLSRLTRLVITLGTMTGGIPPALGNLSNLNTLSLIGNGLTGSIPAELGNLGNLRALILIGNQLTGTVPPELGNLTQLTRLEMNSNQLTGLLPAELGNLTALEKLLLYNNRLTGSIPAEIGNLSALAMLHLNLNSLTGGIPEQIGTMSALVELNLRGNFLDGAIPHSVGSLAIVQTLNLRDNALSGSVPAELSGLPALERIYLDGNQLTGIERGALTDLPSIKSIALDRNILPQSAVDRVLTQIYALRAEFLSAIPNLTLRAPFQPTNAVPSGQWTDPLLTPGLSGSNSDWTWVNGCHEPLSGMATAYALEVSNCGPTFTHWSVSGVR